MNKTIIETIDLQKNYGEGDNVTAALRGVTFSIERGEFVAIMGPSGSGKSTLLHILGFLDTPSSGEYIFHGKKLETYTEDDLARIRNEKIGFVFQAFNLLRRTTVLDNVKLPLLYSHIAESQWEERALHSIRLVNLEHRLHHEPSQLSGGEQQRVAIARALINRPQVIFADEPTGNLDSQSGQMVMETLQKLHEEQGHTIVLITHETSTAEHAERIIHMRDGKLEKMEKVAHRRKAGAFSK